MTTPYGANLFTSGPKLQPLNPPRDEFHPRPRDQFRSLPYKPRSALDKYLGKDASYQRTLRDLGRALTDYRARMGIEKTRTSTEYGFAKRQMGQQQQNDLRDIKDDFAARGIVTSGVFASRIGEYNTQYNNQLGTLTRGYNNQLQDFQSAYQEFLRNQQSQKEAAREAAIRRRAAKLGLT